MKTSCDAEPQKEYDPFHKDYIRKPVEDTNMIRWSIRTLRASLIDHHMRVVSSLRKSDYTSNINQWLSDVYVKCRIASLKSKCRLSKAPSKRMP